ncbi:MAG: hypothetical protein Q4F56_00800 [Candidatus Saccharibacteria bacterium]|nr:hypothetical protein [Candidatus Saccharibacteria bacterium]
METQRKKEGINMAKEIAIGKRAKISEAQQYMILSVLGASVFFGAAISLISHFIQQISFNTEVIMAEDESIVAYSNVIKSTGICKSPSGNVYSDSELEICDPDSIEASEIPGTLRANILENLAANEALNSVPKENDSNCINPSTNKNYTYKELIKMYSDARGASELQDASNLIKSCSALRVIPDALPAFKNEEALLASLNKLYLESNWEPESFGSSGTSEVSSLSENLNEISINSTVETDSAITMSVLNNIERSIRQFDIKRATIEWSEGALNLQFQATAYFTNEATVTETVKTITPEENI